MTSYNITGLNDNTVYHVNVTASNNAGSSNSTSTSIINSSSGKFIICMQLQNIRNENAQTHVSTRQ